MNPLSPDQSEVVATALTGMQTAYNQFKVEPCHFAGIPDDLSSLDYISYELPMPDEYTAGSPASSLAWGNVMTTSFGFCWIANDDCLDPRMFALRHEDPSVLIFPYYRLLEITESSGDQDSPAESLWFDTIRYFDQHLYLPDGWHPVFDAIHCPEKIGCPSSMTTACRRLVNVRRDFYYTMSTYPYDWAKNREWDKLREYVDQLANDQFSSR